MGTKSQTVSKLLNFKSWLELDDAARHLSSILGEEVVRADLLSLALEGHLKLSVRFTCAVSALPGKAVPYEQAERREIPTLDGEGFFISINGTVLPGTEQVIVYEDQIMSICDVWDIPMLGGDRLSVEIEYEKASNREIQDPFNLAGTFVTDSNGIYCKLMERFENRIDKSKPFHDPINFYPAAFLPEESALVVRTNALLELSDRLAQKPPSAAASPVGRRERSTLLVIIAALARMARVDVERTSSAASSIESETERMGARVAARTIENHLKLIGDALDDRRT